MHIAQRIEVWPIERLTPYERNARTHSPEQVAQIAASIAEFGFNNPVLVAGDTGIIAGHGRLAAARRLGLTEVPVIVLDHMTPAQRRAYVLADNRLAELAGWDLPMLSDELRELNDDGFDLSLAGFGDDELAALLSDGVLPNDGQATTVVAQHERAAPGTREGLDDAPAPAMVVTSQPGDVWILGDHRVMCGSSTDARDVAKLMAGRTAHLLHADPPYGMGKEADGVANDNLRGKALDGFQMDWWGAYRPHLQSNASAYVWGNAPDLWRLWYVAGLGDSEPITIKNEIVWDKKNIAGMASPDLTQYPEATERCLFFVLGRYVLQINQKKEDYWPGWEPIRSWLCEQRDAAGFSAADVKRICGNHMYGHWFSQSQWSIISRENYEKLSEAAAGKAFSRPYDDLRAEYERLQAVFNGEVGDGLRAEFRAARPYFDNAHDVMRDVWEFPRVIGDERHGHATPKPVAMMERCINSSTRPGELVVEPFGGSGSTLIGAEATGRSCYTMELQGLYVDVIVRRWQNLTGRQAIHEGSGLTFAQLEQQRSPANDNAEGAHAVA